MRNIMLISVAILTIATANATSWLGVLPMKIVNNTNVPAFLKLDFVNQTLGGTMSATTATIH